MFLINLLANFSTFSLNILGGLGICKGEAPLTLFVVYGLILFCSLVGVTTLNSSLLTLVKLQFKPCNAGNVADLPVNGFN